MDLLSIQLHIVKRKNQHVAIFLNIFQKNSMDTEYFLIWVGWNICKILLAIYIFSFYNIKINACFQNLFTVQYSRRIQALEFQRSWFRYQFCYFSLGLRAILGLNFLLCKMEVIIVLTIELWQLKWDAYNALIYTELTH